MNKQDTLLLIEEKLAQGVITKDEIQGLLKVQTKNDTPSESTKNLTNVFYIIGGIIALLGVIILILENWQEIGFFGRMMVTLGVAVATYIAGLLFKKDDERVLSEVLFIMSAILGPIGAFVFLNEYQVTVTALTQFWIWLGLFVVYLSAYIFSRRHILVLAGVKFASLSYFSLLSYLFIMNGDLFKYACMVLGVSILLVAYYYQYQIALKHPEEKREKNIIESLLYAAGVFLLIAPAMAISDLFDFVAILLIFGGFYASVYIKNRVVLVLSALFLIAHVIKLTSIHFAESIGWPLSLILLGFAVIGIGYGALYVNRTYIPKKEKNI